MARDPETIDDSMLRLLLTAGLGPRTWSRLAAIFGPAPEAIVDGLSSGRRAPPRAGLGSARLASLRRSLAGVRAADVAAERRRMTGRSIRLVVLGDEDYPALLATVDTAPPALWVRGELRDVDLASVGVVGSRACSRRGLDEAAIFAGVLGSAGLTIVSGGARGVDTAAHRAAIDAGGRTIAVLGCGLGRDYPTANRGLFERIAGGHGALVSELPTFVPPRPSNFPRRNRVISGMSLGIVVVEADERSGALITARIAAGDHGREVLAVPGPIDMDSKRGCHRAIREGWAALAARPADVLETLASSTHLARAALEQSGVDPSALRSAAADLARSTHDGSGGERTTGGEPLTGLERPAPPDLSPGQRTVLSALQPPGTIRGLDELIRAVGLEPAVAQAELTTLEVLGCVTRAANGLRATVLLRDGAGTAAE